MRFARKKQNSHFIMTYILGCIFPNRESKYTIQRFYAQQFGKQRINQTTYANFHSHGLVHVEIIQISKLQLRIMQYRKWKQAIRFYNIRVIKMDSLEVFIPSSSYDMGCYCVPMGPINLLCMNFIVLFLQRCHFSFMFVQGFM